MLHCSNSPPGLIGLLLLRSAQFTKLAMLFPPLPISLEYTFFHLRISQGVVLLEKYEDALQVEFAGMWESGSTGPGPCDVIIGLTALLNNPMQ